MSFHGFVVFSQVRNLFKDMFVCFFHFSDHGNFILKNYQRYYRNARQCNQVKVRRSGTPAVGHLTL